MAPGVAAAPAAVAAAGAPAAAGVAAGAAPTAGGTTATAGACLLNLIKSRLLFLLEAGAAAGGAWAAGGAAASGVAGAAGATGAACDWPCELSRSVLTVLSSSWAALIWLLIFVTQAIMSVPLQGSAPAGEAAAEAFAAAGAAGAAGTAAGVSGAGAPG